MWTEGVLQVGLLTLKYKYPLLCGHFQHIIECREFIEPRANNNVHVRPLYSIIM